MSHDSVTKFVYKKLHIVYKSIYQDHNKQLLIQYNSTIRAWGRHQGGGPGPRVPQQGGPDGAPGILRGEGHGAREGRGHIPPLRAHLFSVGQSASHSACWTIFLKNRGPVCRSWLCPGSSEARAAAS